MKGDFSAVVRQAAVTQASSLTGHAGFPACMFFGSRQRCLLDATGKDACVTSSSTKITPKVLENLNMTDVGGAFLFMSSELEELYQEVILDHSRRPRNFGELPDAAVLVHGDNPACGDEIHLAIKFDKNGGLEDIKFNGRGCAISQASASLMTMKLKGKSRTEVMEMLQAFHDLVTTGTSEAPKTLGDLRVMQGVRKFPQRVKCAMLAWRAVQQAYEQGSGEATVSTEPA